MSLSHPLSMQHYHPFDFNPISTFVSISSHLSPLLIQFIQEFFERLCDRLESRLKGTSQENAINTEMRGSLCQQIICHGSCKGVREKLEAFYTISLDVKGFKSLHESMENFIKSEFIDDFKCEACNARVKTEKRAVVNQLPNTIVLHLKRFELNFETFQREKVMP
jgi:ubiquitin carboxyl-terminal hydrolase 34